MANLIVSLNYIKHKVMILIKKKLLLFGFTLLLLFSTTVFAQHDTLSWMNSDSILSSMFFKAAKKGDRLMFQHSLMKMETLNVIKQFKNEKDTIIKTIILFENKMFLRKPDSLNFLLHIYIAKFLHNYIEYSETVNSLFSNYFVSNLRNSCDVLNQITNNKILEIIVQHATYTEGNGEIILNYIKKNKLTTKKYYKLFIKYK